MAEIRFRLASTAKWLHSHRLDDLEKGGETGRKFRSERKNQKGNGKKQKN